MPLSRSQYSNKRIIVIGGGPAGLIAAETIAHAGCPVTVYDQKPSVGRKFLMAGRGGLNLTHNEEFPAFLGRYNRAEDWLAPSLSDFTPKDLRDWCEGLGEQTFVGSSGRVFPKSMKTSPLLRSWLKRLDALDVKFKPRHRWLGWDDKHQLHFQSHADGEHAIKANATVIALGGASWPRLGSDGSWTEILDQAGVPLAPLQPANCGFLVDWSQYFKDRFEGTALKNVKMSHEGVEARGDAIITSYGIEGGVIYALSSGVREELALNGQAQILLDLRPDVPEDALGTRLAKKRKGQSLSNHLRKAAGLSPQAINLLRESRNGPPPESAPELAALIKALPLVMTAPRGIDRAISSAGGIKRDGVTSDFMLSAKPGVFAAGEMLDWEAPTGGYLLQASFATGVAAAKGALKWIAQDLS